MGTDIQIALFISNGIMREGLSYILTEEGFTVVSVLEQFEKAEFPKSSSEDPVQIIVSDTDFSSTGEGFYHSVRKRHPAAMIVALADKFDFDTVVNAFRLGVSGYLIKDISSKPLVGALRLVALGEKVMPSQMAQFLGERPYPMGWSMNLADVDLSEREMEVLQLLILGAANKVIGRRLGICEATVKVHVKAALRKLQVTNRTQAAIWALQRGLIAYEADGGAADDQVKAPPVPVLFNPAVPPAPRHLALHRGAA